MQAVGARSVVSILPVASLVVDNVAELACLQRAVIALENLVRSARLLINLECLSEANLGVRVFWLRAHTFL